METGSSALSPTKSRTGEVTRDKYDTLGPLLAGVGGELAEIVGGSPDGVFLYAEAGEGWIGAGVFKDDGAHIKYFDPSSELTDLLLKAWNAEEPSKRWAVMEYEVKGTRFDVQFQFPDEIDPEESEGERRPRALERRFGEKPVIYPPWPGAEESSE
jgi:hypothetical protein